MVDGRTHKPVIHPEKCHTCDVCLRGCPAQIIPEYRTEETSLRGMLYREKLQGVSLKTRDRSSSPLSECLSDPSGHSGLCGPDRQGEDEGSP